MPILENAQHEQFCQEYQKDLNAKQAYLRAYPESSEKSAESGASRLLRNDKVQQRNSELQKKKAEKQGITADRVLKEIADVAFANIGLVAVWDENGKITLKEKEEMGIGLPAVSSIQSVDTYDKDGNHLSTKNKFTMHDKLKALELLSKHLGLLDGNGSEDKGKNKDSIRARIFDIADRITARTGNSGSKP